MILQKIFMEYQQEFIEILKHVLKVNKDLQERLNIMEEILHSYIPVIEKVLAEGYKPDVIVLPKAGFYFDELDLTGVSVQTIKDKFGFVDMKSLIKRESIEPNVNSR